MPKFELGDLDSVAKYKEKNIPVLAAAVRDGWDITAAIPSCVLMFRQELPLMFPDDEDVQLVKRHIFDPFEYLWQRHQAKLLKTEFMNALGKVAWHAPCHQRVQNIGPKTRDVLALVPGTEVTDDRALLGPRRHVRRQDRDVRDRAQDRQAGREPHPAERAGSFRERLSDGRVAPRARHGRQARGGEPDQPVALRLRNLKFRKSFLSLSRLRERAG